MLVSDVDVPFNAPHTLAFRAAGERFAALRDALRSACERGDGEALRACWRTSIGGYRAKRAQARWRVPAATLLELTDELQQACSKIEREPFAEAQPEPGDLEALRAQCKRIEQLTNSADSRITTTRPGSHVMIRRSRLAR